MDKPVALGIDLGTANSSVAVYEFGGVKIIPNEFGKHRTPSCVAFTHNDYLLVGEEAKNQAAINPRNTVYDVKRLIGQRFTDESVQSDVKNLPYNVIDNGGKPNIEVNFKEQTKIFSPEEITSMILLKMKETVEAYLGSTVTDAVISVPAYFNNSQRTATKNAGEIAGLNVLRIINETSASAIAYGMKKKAQGERNVMIFDMGGGTLDVTILTIDDDMFEVKCTSGNTHLGGLDFDNRLVQYFVKEFKRKHKKDISNDNKRLRRLRTACEQAKQTLSTANQAQIEIRSLINNVDFRSSITRTKFEELCSDLFASIMESVNQTLDDSKMKESDIHEIILIGGSSRIPKVRQMLQELFNRKELQTPFSADESVAYGAAVQAGMIIGDEALNDLLLIEVTPLTIGNETYGNTMAPLIKQNSSIPIKQIQNINSKNIQQTNLGISVYEGEDKFISGNNQIGRVILKGIKPPNSSAIIEVAYELDFDGILQVTAGYQNTDTTIQISTIQSVNLVQSEIDRMTKQIETIWRDNEKRIYQKLVELEDVWKCVLNVKLFECPVCFGFYKPGEGIVLRECLHIFCRDCLKGTIEHNDEVQVGCPYQENYNKCKFSLQHREIKEIASRETYERYLRMSLSVAEQQFENSFHCKTPDCPGWCIFECAHFFDCPVCKHQNCINCQVIHEGMDCRQYQEDLLLKAAHDEEAKKTKQHLEEQLTRGLAMHCPKCQVIIMKIDGCDGVICTMCKTDICWATKGPRWGPKGRGDTSGGCGCVFAVRPCHPDCGNCH